MTRCEYIERKTPSKNILEFLKHFSSRSLHKLFFDHPVEFLFLAENQVDEKIVQGLAEGFPSSHSSFICSLPIQKPVCFKDFWYTKIELTQIWYEFN